jgi:CRISPR-associated protein Csy2
MRRILLIPDISIHNANSLSSPYTIGFPAMTAWLGATHALQRKLNQQGFEKLAFKGSAIACHDFNLQTYKGSGDFVHSIIGTGNPLTKDGERSAFIEEARCHLKVSVLIEYEGLDLEQEAVLCETVTKIIQGSLKIAGGDVLNIGKPCEIQIISNDLEFRKLMRKLMPSYMLIERRDLMTDSMNAGQDAIDALLNHLKIKHSSHLNNDKVEWNAARHGLGWIVPIATGFQGISPLENAMNQRDPDTPHRFAESIVTLGEFKMPFRMTSLDEILWSYSVDLNNDLYLCQIKNLNS